MTRRTRSAESNGEMWCFSSTIVMPSGTATSSTSERLRTTVSSVCWVWLSGWGHQSPRGLWLVGRTPLAGTPIFAASRATSRAPSTPRLRVSSSVLTMLRVRAPDLEELQAIVIHGLAHAGGGLVGDARGGHREVRPQAAEPQLAGHRDQLVGHVRPVAHDQPEQPESHLVPPPYPVAGPPRPTVARVRARVNRLSASGCGSLHSRPMVATPSDPIARRSARPTISDVAQRAGVDRAVVSKVLSNDPGLRVRDETRERVRQAAADLGYLPNFHARGLARAKAGALGLLVPDGNPLFHEIMAGAEEAATQRDLHAVDGHAPRTPARALPPAAARRHRGRAAGVGVARRRGRAGAVPRDAGAGRSWSTADRAAPIDG